MFAKIIFNMKVVEGVVRVTRNYQNNIPVSIRPKVNIKEGGLAKIFYVEVEGFIKIIPQKRKRATIRVVGV